MIGITARTAQAALKLQGSDIHALMAEANAARLRCRGHGVYLCGVVNAKSGLCPEDCKFCAQSVHSEAEIDSYPLLEEQQLVEAAQLAEYNRASRVGIVTSGGALTDRDELGTICGAVGRIDAELAVEPCASLGCVNRSMLEELKQSGLRRYHHNLETAESFFEQICATRSWSDSVATINAAKDAGLSVCCGGILGLGESPAQRIEFLESIRDLEVDSVPLNFFNPVPGNRVGDESPLTPL
jgi:biotin synthase